MQKNSASRLALLCAAASSFLFTAAELTAQDPPKKPLRLNNWLGTPEYLRVSGTHRTRFEGLHNQFRDNAALRNDENQLANRSTLRVDYMRNEFGATIEGIDGRMFGTKDDSFANDTTVDTLDVLQAYATYDLGDGHRISAGRFTMDVGSRRLVARNEYRNTVNSFNGVRWDYRNDERGYEAGAFWTMPTIRRPTDRMMLVDNEHDWNRQSTDFQFFGAHATKRIDEGSTAQLMLFGYDDQRGTNDDTLWTIGARYHRPEQRGKISGELDAAYQIGERGTQDVEAHFLHLSTGYTCDCDMQPTVRLALDLATGNDSSNDYTRFNTLFGARRFDYGPTGIYGPVGRRNIVSPELRFSLRPTPTTWVMLAWRDIMLHSSNDAWVEAGDGSGDGKHIGSQTELRLRWDPCSSNLRFELGGAYLAGGNFRDTSASGRASDTRYVYFETIFTF